MVGETKRGRDTSCRSVLCGVAQGQGDGQRTYRVGGEGVVHQGAGGADEENRRNAGPRWSRDSGAFGSPKSRSPKAEHDLREAAGHRQAARPQLRLASIPWPGMFCLPGLSTPERGTRGPSIRL